MGENYHLTMLYIRHYDELNPIRDGIICRVRLLIERISLSIRSYRAQDLCESRFNAKIGVLGDRELNNEDMCCLLYCAG